MYFRKDSKVSSQLDPVFPLSTITPSVPPIGRMTRVIVLDDLITVSAALSFVVALLFSVI